MVGCFGGSDRRDRRLHLMVSALGLGTSRNRQAMLCPLPRVVQAEDVARDASQATCPAYVPPPRPSLELLGHMGRVGHSNGVARVTLAGSCSVDPGMLEPKGGGLVDYDEKEAQSKAKRPGRHSETDEKLLKATLSDRSVP